MIICVSPFCSFESKYTVSTQGGQFYVGNTQVFENFYKIKFVVIVYYLLLVCLLFINVVIN